MTLGRFRSSLGIVFGKQPGAIIESSKKKIFSQKIWMPWSTKCINFVPNYEQGRGKIEEKLFRILQFLLGQIGFQDLFVK